MSYILDALRKAEHQRQQGQPQTIYTPPSPLEQERRSARGALWIAALLGLLLLNALLLGFWWRFAGPASRGTEASSSAVEAQLIAPSSSAPAAAARSSPAAGTSAADETPDLPPLLGDLPQSTKQLLPALGIQAHIHVQGDRSKSVVMLNSEMLREGEKGSSGVEVVRIDSDEVLLRYRRTEFRMKVRR